MTVEVKLTVPADTDQNKLCRLDGYIRDFTGGGFTGCECKLNGVEIGSACPLHQITHP